MENGGLPTRLWVEIRPYVRTTGVVHTHYSVLRKAEPGACVLVPATAIGRPRHVLHNCAGASGASCAEGHFGLKSGHSISGHDESSMNTQQQFSKIV